MNLKAYPLYDHVVAMQPSLLEPTNVSNNQVGCHTDYRLYYTEPLVQLV